MTIIDDIIETNFKKTKLTGVVIQFDPRDIACCCCCGGGGSCCCCGGGCCCLKVSIFLVYGLPWILPPKK
jgi:hypothetical protein